MEWDKEFIKNKYFALVSKYGDMVQFEDKEAFGCWLYAHGYKRGMIVRRRDPKKPFNQDNCYLAIPSINKIGGEDEVARLMKELDLSRDTILDIGRGEEITPEIIKAEIERKIRWQEIKKHSDFKSLYNRYYAMIHNANIQNVSIFWKTPKEFIEWSINNGFSKDLFLTRIDWNKGYSPDNCRWTSEKTQWICDKAKKVVNNLQSSKGNPLKEKNNRSKSPSKEKRKQYARDYYERHKDFIKIRATAYTYKSRARSYMQKIWKLRAEVKKLKSQIAELLKNKAD